MRGLSMIAGLAVAGLLTTGCGQTVGGAAVRTVGDAAIVQELQQFLLAAGEIDTVVGTTGIDVADDTTEMADHAQANSEQGCLGSVYQAERSVYADADWSGVVGQVLTEPGADSGVRVEQSIVEMTSAPDALDFFNASRKNWSDCIARDVAVDDDSGQTRWHIEGIAITGTTMMQGLRRIGGPPWACQHALGTAGRHIAEVSVCSAAPPTGEAMVLANQILAGIH